MQGRVSLVVTTIKGEEEYLASCLSSVRGFADEIVVVDMSGEGEIGKISKKYGAKYFKHEFVNYVEPVRNFGLSKASGDWILILDPDEELTGELKKRLKEVVENDEADFVRIPRKNIVFGEYLKHSRWWPDYNIRFFKKNTVSWGDEIHSIPLTQGRGMDLEAKEELSIVHHHYQSVSQFLQRMDRYTGVQAKHKAKSEKFNWKDLIVKPGGEFLSRFFAGEGYKDGVHGLALSFLQAFSEFVVYLKVWELAKFEKKELDLKEVIGSFDEMQREFKYWENDAILKENGGILPRVKRRLRI